MKAKILILSLALLITLLPASGAIAATPIYEGSVQYTNQEPVQVTYKTCSTGDSTFNTTTHTWAPTVIGAGTCTLTMTAANTGSTGYTVNVNITPGSSTDGTITAAWNTESRYLAAGTDYDFVLTVISTAATTPQVVSLTFGFSR